MNDTELALCMKRGEDVLYDLHTLYRSKNYNSHEFVAGALAYLAAINAESPNPQSSMDTMISLFKSMCVTTSKGKV